MAHETRTEIISLWQFKKNVKKWNAEGWRVVSHAEAPMSNMTVVLEREVSAAPALATTAAKPKRTFGQCKHKHQENGRATVSLQLARVCSDCGASVGLAAELRPSRVSTADAEALREWLATKCRDRDLATYVDKVVSALLEPRE